MKSKHGYIFGPNKIPKKGDPLLWVKGNRVINGEWDLKVSSDNTTAFISYTGSTVYNLCPAPYENGDNYNDVLRKAENNLKYES